MNDSSTPPPPSAWSGWQYGLLAVFAGLCAALVLNAWQRPDIHLTDLKFDVLAGENEPLIDKGWDGKPLQIANSIYPKGLAVEPGSVIELRYLPNNYDWFAAEAGISSTHIPGGPEAAVFRVIADGTVLYESPVMRPGMAPRLIHVPIAGRKTLTLRVETAPDDASAAKAVWGWPRFVQR